MRMRNVLLVLALAVVLATGGAISAYGASPNKAVFATLDQVNALIAEAEARLNASISTLAERLGLIETGSAQQEARIAALEDRVAALEAIAEQQPPFTLIAYVQEVRGSQLLLSVDVAVLAQLGETERFIATSDRDQPQSFGVVQTPTGPVLGAGQRLCYFSLPEYFDDPSQNPGAMPATIWTSYMGKVAKVETTVVYPSP